MRLSRGRRPRGFSLFDLLIIIALIGLLLALLLPAIQKVRAAANRVTCQNNVRQIGIACHNCNDAFGTLPPYRAGPGAELPAKSTFAKAGNNGSVLFFLLPFLEQAALYNSAAFQGADGAVYSVNVTANSKEEPANPPKPPLAAEVVVKTYLCPSDPTLPADGLQMIKGTGFGPCSYACNFLVFGLPNAKDQGDNRTPAGLRNPDGYDGSDPVKTHAPVYLPRIPATFTDGLATTILFGEKYSTCNWYLAGTVKAPKPGGNIWAGVAYPALDSQGNTAQYAPAIAMESPWNDGTKFQVFPSADQCNVAYGQTGHADGMVIIMADASARTISPSIAAKTWTALCTPQGGEVLGSDW
jgi:hypothetical protein